LGARDEARGVRRDLRVLRVHHDAQRRADERERDAHEPDRVALRDDRAGRVCGGRLIRGLHVRSSAGDHDAGQDHRGADAHADAHRGARGGLLGALRCEL
ncbi:MAG: hypothetical protein ACK559_39150, partial [bacterium]